MHAHETPVLVEHERIVTRARERLGLASLLLAAAALVFAVACLLGVLWLILDGTTATPFDADGVRCYGKALQLSCLKTATP